MSGLTLPIRHECQPFDTAKNNQSRVRSIADDSKRESEWHDSCFRNA
jgi:hypothetical protein